MQINLTPEYVRIDNVCSQEQLQACLQELKFLLPAFKEAEHTGVKKPEHIDVDIKEFKKNKAVFLNEVYHQNFAEYSPNISVLTKTVKELKDTDFTACSAMNYLKISGVGFSVHLGAFKNGGYYKPHRDSSTITVLFWVSEENFNGGDLIFTDFNYTVPFKNNTIIAFPSHYIHEITPVVHSNEEYVRFCATAFVNVGV